MLKKMLRPSQGQWDDQLPFRRVTSMMQVFSALPTLPLHEWTCRYLLVVCLRHAIETNKLELLQSALGAAYMTSFLSRIAKEDVRFPAQATVMLNPRETAYEHEHMTVALYIAALAARRHGGLLRSALGEAALAGLLTHLFCSPTDVSGPRFVWWTWHEAHPAVHLRILNFPVSQALAELSLGAGFSLLAGWFLESFRRTSVASEDSMQIALKQIIHWIPEQNRSLLEFAANASDTIRDQLRQSHFLARVGLVALVAPALHATLSSLVQIGSLDKVGSPSVRSYKAMLALLVMFASAAPARTLPVTISDSRAGARLAASVVAYFAVQAVIPFVGDPAKHVSTGLHQTYGRAGDFRKDAFGTKYEQNLSKDEYQYFSIEGSTRAARLKELEDMREALDDVAQFLKAADKRVGDTQLALQETMEWSKQAQTRVPHLREEKDLVRDLEASNSVRLARIKAHLETKLEKIKTERHKIASYEHKLRGKIARLEDILDVGSVDPAGNAVVPASPVGPASVWYTIRGILPNGSRRLEEQVGTALLCALGMTAFTRALAYGS